MSNLFSPLFGKRRRPAMPAAAPACAAAAVAPEEPGFRAGQMPEAHVYKTVDGQALRLFVRRPRAAFVGPRPAILLFHGGGWRTGAAGRVDALARELAAQGLVAVAVEYRLLPAHERLRVPHEAIQDARSALRHVRAQARELGIDAGRIAAGGPSAGGHLAMMTALMPPQAPGFDAPGDDLAVSPRPQALLLLSAVYTADGHHRAQGIAERALRPVTPQWLVGADNLPPTLMLHGMADRATPYASAQAFLTAAKAAAPLADVSLVAFPGHGHGFALARMDDATAARAREAIHGFFVRQGWMLGPLPAAPWMKKGGWGRAQAIGAVGEVG